MEFVYALIQPKDSETFEIVFLREVFIFFPFLRFPLLKISLTLYESNSFARCHALKINTCFRSFHVPVEVENYIFNILLENGKESEFFSTVIFKHSFNFG